MRCLMCFILLLLVTKTFAANSSPEQQITDQLTSPDPAIRQAGLVAVREYARVNSGGYANPLRKLWLTPMSRAGFHQDIVELTGPALLIYPSDRQEAETLLRGRAYAYMALGDREKALVEAKRLYNVCRSDQTGMAVDVIVAAIIVGGDAKDIERARRFKMRQTLAARGETLSDIRAGPPTDDVKEPDNFLKSITLDDALFAPEIDRLKTQRNTRLRTARGNLLLMAGRIVEAREVFESLQSEAADVKAVANAMERLVAVMRAEDGNTDRANASVRRLRESE